jgi:hypothetical protein
MFTGLTFNNNTNALINQHDHALQDYHNYMHSQAGAWERDKNAQTMTLLVKLARKNKAKVMRLVAI